MYFGSVQLDNGCRVRPNGRLPWPDLGWHRAAMLNTTDVMVLAIGGYLNPEELQAIAENIEHLAQLVDDPGDAAETYRAAAAIRSVAALR
jgi:hypothetical protein